MTTINTYLTFNGNCEIAFNFYRSVFGGEFAHIGKFKDMPKGNSDCVINDADLEKIMHISFPISKHSVLMGSDSGGDWSSKFICGTNFSISINTDTEEEANRLFNELSIDGSVIMPLEKTFWGSLFGMFTDQFGVQWMVSYDEIKKH